MRENLFGTILACAATSNLGACGGEIIDVGEAQPGAARLSDAGDAAAPCTAAGVALDTIYTSQGVSPTAYSYGASPVSCGAFGAETLGWKEPDPGGLIGLYRQVSASPFQGQLTRIVVHLRGEDVAAAFVDVNMIDDQGSPVGFATTEGELTIGGSFGWTTYALTFETPSNASTLTVGLDLARSGTLDVAQVEVSVP
jgi:hypothetical protein